MIGEIISHYRILEKLGEGGMGVVYKAEDTRLKRAVALKFLPRQLSESPEDRTRFIQEAQSASSLNHPNISHIYEIDEARDGMFIAMEFIDGRSLRDLIDAGPLKIAEALRIGVQIARGLQAAHGKGIVHRDLKPENILLTNSGEAKVADFGLALTPGNPAESRPRLIAGTIAYMSPEQVRGEYVSYRSDIWSLGVILYEMVSGHRPFSGDYEESLIYSIGNEKPPRLPGDEQQESLALQSIIDRALEKDMRNRYQDIGQMLSALQDLERGLSVRREHASGPEASIAVLPFSDISPGRDNKYFSDGLTEEIIASLSKLRSLRVISRTSAMRYEGTQKSLKQIAAELGVHFVLEGSVRKHGNDLRITTELIEAEQDASLWADKYQGTMDRVFDIQEEVAGKIVEALRVKLTAEEKRTLKKRFTEDAEAFQLYLKGRYFWNRRDNENLRIAIRYFQQAIDLDQRYAPAWVGLSDAYSLLAEDEQIQRRVELEKARSALRRALEIDIQLAEAHASLAILLMLGDWNWAEAEKEYRLAIGMDPNYATAHHWYAELLSLSGRPEEALREISMAAALDPVSPAIIKDHGIILYYARLYDEALEQGRRLMELDPRFAGGHRLLSLAYEAKAMIPEAIEENRLWGSLTGDSAETGVGLGYIYAVSGKRHEALEAIAPFRNEQTTRGNLLRGIALVYVALNDPDEAFRWLEKALAVRAESLCNMKVDPKVDGIRNDPRFDALLRQVGLEGGTMQKAK